jgi:hypothetical protein
VAKDRRSRDQKRKAKLAQRAHKHKTLEVEPYEGTKYQQDAWTPLVYATEKAIYEVILQTVRQLTNDEVEKAFVDLVLALRRGLAPALSPEEAEPELVVGQASANVVWNIRRHWTEYFASFGNVAVADLIGILRTLLFSIEAHQANTGRRRGYVAFLQGFLEERGLDRDQALVPGALRDDWDEDDREEEDGPDAPDQSRVWR